MAEFFLGILIRNRLTNHRFWLLNVYGPAHHDLSWNFIQEMSRFCERECLPILMGVTLT